MATLMAFSRPHTIIGTTLSVVALHLLATLETGRSAGWVQGFAVVVGSLAINLYIVGLNQITDVEIDRINKPWLPLAAGSLRMRHARALVAGAALSSLAIGVAVGPYALSAFVIGFVVGTAYSLPPLRLKHSALWAALSIAGVRGLAVNLLLYLHFASVVGAPANVPPPLVVLTAIVLAISLVIAWFKDIPDADGDRHFRVHTLTLRLGAQRVLTLGLTVLGIAYGAVIVAGIRGVPGLHGGVLAGAHLAAFVVLVVAAANVDLSRQPSIARFYLVIWALFYAEYLVFPAAGLLAT